MTQVVEFVANEFYWVFLGILLLNVFQRRHHKTAVKKRFATLYLGGAAFVIFLIANAVVQYGLPTYALIVGVAAVVVVLYIFRRHTFPFTLRCQRSGRRLDFHTILFRDSNILPDYDDDAAPASDAPSPDTSKE